jgi:hypothetical protein
VTVHPHARVPLAFHFFKDRTITTNGPLSQSAVASCDRTTACRACFRFQVLVFAVSTEPFGSITFANRPAFACSLLLDPPPRQLLSRVAFPGGETTGLPRFVAVTVWVRSRRFVGDASAAPEELKTSGPDPVPFGPSVSASYACP